VLEARAEVKLNPAPRKAPRDMNALLATVLPRPQELDPPAIERTARRVEVPEAEDVKDENQMPRP